MAQADGSAAAIATIPHNLALSLVYSAASAPTLHTSAFLRGKAVFCQAGLIDKPFLLLGVGDGAALPTSALAGWQIGLSVSLGVI